MVLGGTRFHSYLFPHILDKLTLPGVVVFLSLQSPKTRVRYGEVLKDAGDPLWEGCGLFSGRE